MDNAKDNETGVVIGFAVIGAIIGTIMFCSTTFGEWYAEFDLEPVGLITGILTIVLWLLPFALSVIIGGGAGAVVGGLIGFTIVAIVKWIYYLYTSMRLKINQKIEQIQRKRKIKSDTQAIKKVNQFIDKKIMRYNELRAEGINRNQAYSVMHLCDLLVHIRRDVNLEACISEIDKRMKVLNEIDSIEKEIEDLAMKYKNVGNIDQYKYYARIINKL